MMSSAKDGSATNTESGRSQRQRTANKIQAVMERVLTEKQVRYAIARRCAPMCTLHASCI
jgi:hypothetical protein